MTTEVATKKPTLMAIAQDAMALEQLIFEESGELSETLEKWLGEIQNNLTDKVDNYHFLMQRFESSSEMLRKRAGQITGAARSLDNVVDRMKGRIKEAMHLGGLQEILGSDFRFKLARGADRVVIDERQVDPSFFTERVVRELDKEKLLLAAKAAEAEDKPLPSGIRFEPTSQLRPYVRK